MYKSTVKVLGLIICIFLVGCQETSQPNEESEKVITNDKATLKLPCKMSSPPIKDKSKIKDMLLKSGKITSEMSEVEANKAVNNYIRKKREAFKRCNK